MPAALVHQKTHTLYIFVKKTVFNNQCPSASFLIFYQFTKDFKKNLSTSQIFIIKRMCPYISCFLFNDDDH